MALFELKQEYSGAEGAAPPLTFKDCAAADIDAAFFEQDEHADWHTVDGKDALVIVDDQRLKEHSAHWEAGAKQNFDTGLYTAYTVLYIRVSDYGPKPKVGKHLCSGQRDEPAAVVHHPQLRGGGGRVPHFHGKDAAMSRVTYDAGNLTIEVDGWTPWRRRWAI